MKRIEKNKISDNQTLEYPEQDLTHTDIDKLCDVPHLVFRFQWASDTIDKLLRSGLMCYDYLDIGSCQGEMLFIVSKKKNINGDPIHIDGIEPHGGLYGALCNTAKDIPSISVHNTMFEDYKTEDRYDIVTAFEILEHSKDPVFFLEKIYNLLRINGFLMMSVPEERGKFGVKDANPFHYWAFNLQSLVRLFDENKWYIQAVFEVSNLIHVVAQKVK
jgi:2-polyprenyl-3-methyl-5-hydroxy-6-metoxy-1,4-benzoquinol methylase